MRHVYNAVTATLTRGPDNYMTANNDHTHSLCTWLTLWLAQLEVVPGGLVILSKSSWNDETLALPGEGATKLAGVGGCELTPSYNEHTHHHVYLPSFSGHHNLHSFSSLKWSLFFFFFSFHFLLSVHHFVQGNYFYAFQ